MWHQISADVKSGVWQDDHATGDDMVVPSVRTNAKEQGREGKHVDKEEELFYR